MKAETSMTLKVIEKMTIMNDRQVVLLKNVYDLIEQARQEERDKILLQWRLLMKK